MAVAWLLREGLWWSSVTTLPGSDQAETLRLTDDLRMPPLAYEGDTVLTLQFAGLLTFV